jgi:hypothetical protein
VATAFALLAVAACSDSPTKGGSNGTPAAIAMSGGDNQMGMPGTPLAAPIAVRVTNAQGNPVAGKPVDFTVTRGAGTVASATVTTDNNGVAQTSWTLGTATVRQEVKATINSLVQSAVATVDTTRSLFLLPLRDTVSVGDTIWVSMIAGTSALNGEVRGAVRETISNSLASGAGIVRVIYTQGEFLDVQQPTGPVLNFVTGAPMNTQARNLYMRVGYLARQLGSGHDVVLTHTATSFIGARTFTDLTNRVSVVGAVVHIR